MDKGNYSMFETVRPIVTPGGPPPPNSGPIMYPVFPPHLPHSHIPPERTGVVMLFIYSKPIFLKFRTISKKKSICFPSISIRYHLVEHLVKTNRSLNPRGKEDYAKPKR